MCGIVGFTGEHQAAPILLDGLAKLEYRGYDSAGIDVRDGDADVEVINCIYRCSFIFFIIVIYQFYCYFCICL